MPSTRKRLRKATPQSGATETSAEIVTLQAVIGEIRLMREEHARRERDYAETFRRQEEELCRLRGIISNNTQLSHSYNRVTGDSGTRVASGAGARVIRGSVAISNGAEAQDAHASEGDAIPSGAGTRDAYASERGAIPSAVVARVAHAGDRDLNSSGVGTRIHASDSVAVASADLGYKLKPDTYDGTTPLQEYFSQLSLIARANHWDDATKTIALASSLRGKARSVLETVQDVERLDFAELKTKLELRFGEGRQSQNYYVVFTSRKQKFGEDLATFGSEIDKLSRLAYPECPYELRDKIACAQFITAVSDNFIRRALQMEGITSLILAVERAKALKVIQGDNSERYRENLNKNFVKKGDGNLVKNEERDVGGKTEERNKEGKGPKGNWRGSKFGAGRGSVGRAEKPGISGQNALRETRFS
ncbi:uncharacterized protein LOC143908505 [Temnothorax americanus]|uniref:uncharacterized protein LOC143908505 n=1 Tax=Temnothorax americanus TaxID=1964332 RepID=UPI0040687F6C